MRFKILNIMTKKTIGILLIILSVVTWLIEHLSLLLSISLGQLYCGEHYAQEVGGIISDSSCGFNMDIYLNVFLILISLIAILLIFKKDKQN